MIQGYLPRAIVLIATAILTSGLTVLLLLQLPGICALATMFVGLILFLVGARLNLVWPAGIGGVLMFTGVFAAALLGALG